MDGEGMYIEVLLEQTIHTSVLVDNACGCFAVISERFVRKHKIPIVAITPRRLAQVVEEGEEEAPVISTVAYLSIDIHGFEERIFAYVVPGQVEDMILGIKWMERHDVVLRPAKKRLRIKNWGLRVECAERAPKGVWPRLVGAEAIKVLFARAKKEGKPLQVFAASMQDIQRALRHKIYTDPRAKLPSWLLDRAGAFDRKKADTLPPRRPGIDHALERIVDEKGNPHEIPWSPLYSMSKDELLVLRKTLTELLDKGFIRASNSPAAAPAIFVKKPGGGLRFCVDYRKLNAVTKKDRYPLLLIQETLR